VRRRQRAGIGWLALLAGLAVLALFSAADRLSADRPGLARLVPGAFAAHSGRVAARAALAQEEYALARQEAARALANDPLHRSSPALLGAARLGAGEAAASESAFRVAAQLGWRDLATQGYWFSAALAQGDMPAAMVRAEAIVRINPQFAGRETMFAAFEGDDAGRAALRDALLRGLAPGQRQKWVADYLNLGVEDRASLRRRAGVLQTLPAGSLDCGDAQPPAARLLREGERQAAVELWNRFCPDRPASSGYSDPAFASLSPDAQTPFGWRSAQDGDIAIQPREGGGVVLQNLGASSHSVLWQPVALSPGSYTARVDGGSGDLSDIMVQVGCNNERGPMREARSLSRDGTARIAVPQCDGQTLVVWIDGNSGRIELGALTLDPL
jgi:hypothetical protein